MKVKPKDIKVDLPTVRMFHNSEDIADFAININSIIHGKVKVKYEELGLLYGKCVGIFYLQRNNEFASLRSEFVEAINEYESEGLLK